MDDSDTLYDAYLTLTSAERSHNMMRAIREKLPDWDDARLLDALDILKRRLSERGLRLTYFAESRGGNWHVQHFRVETI